MNGHRQVGDRVGIGFISFLSVLLLLVMGIPSASAADTEAASADATLDGAGREHILQTIEATRASDPELAAEMERQFELMETGEAPRETSGDILGDRLGAPELIGPPVDTSGNFEEVQADPRMQDIHQQFEGGQLSEDQAREKMFDVLRDHGIEPNDGHEWEHQGEHGEGLERAFEHMSTEGREHMESMERETGPMERMVERESMESMERMVEHESMEHEVESPEREFEAPMRESEAPVRESNAPMPEHDTEAPEHMMPEQPAGGM